MHGFSNAGRGQVLRPAPRPTQASLNFEHLKRSPALVDGGENPEKKNRAPPSQWCAFHRWLFTWPRVATREGAKAEAVAMVARRTATNFMVDKRMFGRGSCTLQRGQPHPSGFLKKIGPKKIRVGGLYESQSRLRSNLTMKTNAGSANAGKLI